MDLTSHKMSLGNRSDGSVARTRPSTGRRDASALQAAPNISVSLLDGLQHADVATREALASVARYTPPILRWYRSMLRPRFMHSLLAASIAL